MSETSKLLLFSQLHSHWAEYKGEGYKSRGFFSLNFMTNFIAIPRVTEIIRLPVWPEIGMGG